MRSAFSKGLFALAMLAYLLAGLPVYSGMALAHEPVPHAHHAASAHPDALHGGHHGEDGAAASDRLCQTNHQQLPATDGDACHCPAGLGGATLSDGDPGVAATAWRGNVHGLPPSDQIADSGAFLPPLRPPRA